MYEVVLTSKAHKDTRGDDTPWRYILVVTDKPEGKCRSDERNKEGDGGHGPGELLGSC